MSSARYRSWFQAIRDRRRMSYIHKGELREGCAHSLGLDKDGREKVLVCRIVPGRAARPQWRCLFVEEAAIAGPAYGPWLDSDSNRQGKSCIADVHIDVNRKAEQRFDWGMTKKKPKPAKAGAKGAAKSKKPRTR